MLLLTTGHVLRFAWYSISVKIRKSEAMRTHFEASSVEKVSVLVAKPRANVEGSTMFLVSKLFAVLYSVLSI